MYRVFIMDLIPKEMTINCEYGTCIDSLHLTMRADRIEMITCKIHVCS